ncbi:hypothetical protein BDV96DRAFT_562450 [Lophiotrema nucula]|uniref:Tr-type G domain-containing protein n=1 Tax=Lophiotrema nucula TaxID=690887 RepID=A0A6A5ZQV6_9PLEO|nr:hypothetical protein BDV96DRAFT_562450 [Lophiotrema nucula]
MASIFTYDPDPPRVSSPWSTPPPDSRPRHAIPQDSASDVLRANVGAHRSASTSSATSEVDYSAITKLDAEPQEGPTEYKLHLLLRRRRSFTFTSTGWNISGSLRRIDIPTSSSANRSVSEPGIVSTTPPPLAAIQSRQHRLEQLTTQLLWRLQQSSPNHNSTTTDWIPPQFPEEAQLSESAVPRRVLPGLEESKGALYEIGIADDGTFVGLADDEMEESLNNLRAMAASLGCYVEVLRMVPVGECEWIEHAIASGPVERRVRTSKLCVAEAYVRPDQHRVGQDKTVATVEDTHRANTFEKLAAASPHNRTTLPDTGHSRPSTGIEQDATPQLRVSLTGATMSGKSSLLGSLTTSTLDNGRGKSRLSLLKHRHEIQSGMTSSVTQELIGYSDIVDQDGRSASTQVISYGAGNVSSWMDIHVSAVNGRLVFLSDSAGHPRFRRTTVRGLVGWDPHWTLLCIPADNTENSSGRVGASPSSQEILGPAAADVDLSHAHLQLCIHLGLPLVVIITKLDIATKPGLRRTLAKILSTLKDAGRKPSIISDASLAVPEIEFNVITNTDLEEAETLARILTTSPIETVPIILTSALKGTGIRKLHALLRSLPIPAVVEAPSPSLHALFHIEDIYSSREAHSRLTVAGSSRSPSAVIGGHLRYGALRLGDELVLGPYPVDSSPDDSDSGSGRGSTPPIRSSRRSSVPASRSFPGAHKAQATLQVSRSKSYVNDGGVEWRRVRVTSIRNLRLPVRSLRAGQVGTIGVVPLGEPINTPALVRIRKGMVLAHGELNASRVIAVRFTDVNAGVVKSLTVGSAVVVYVASVRASAKVISVAADPDASIARSTTAEPEDDDDAFGFGSFDDADDKIEHLPKGFNSTSAIARSTTVTFQFIGCKEFVEAGAKVLILPGGGPGLFGGTERGEKGVAGLDGFVGYVLKEAA